MNTRLAQLMKLLDLKQEAVKVAYQNLQKAQEEFKRYKEKHEQLISYRQDYLEQLKVIGQQGVWVGRLRNRVDFITHLDHALTQLNNHLAYLAKIRSNAQSYYQEAERAKEGVSVLITRIKKEENTKLQRKEQQEIDEYAQKQWYSEEIDE